MNFSQTISLWYHQNKRSLPWRNTADPYSIWISEVIMQQTQVVQGTSYYLRFINRFTDVNTLADAEEDDVLKLWEGLGYYSRARNLHAGAKQVMADWQGKIPISYKDLLTIKGIGPYTAAAISSICYNEKQAVVDGNVFRVLARIYGIHTPINSTAGKKEFTALANQLIARATQNGDHNQAVMEFGAIQCTPKNPKCDTCVFQAECHAYKQGLVGELPVKIKPKPVKNRHLNFLVVSKNGALAVEKRRENGIWKGLYQFPLIEADTGEYKHKDGELLSGNIKHLLSHQRLHINFWHAQPQTIDAEAYQWVPLKDINKIAFPVPIKQFIASKLLPLHNRL